MKAKFRGYDAVARKAQHRLQCAIYRLSNGSGNAPWPLLVSFPLTAQCNYRCGFCEITGVDRLLKSQGSPYHANTMAVQHVQQFGPLVQAATSIDLGGMTGLGEPLLSPHLESIIQTIRNLNRKATLCLTTNASLLKQELSELLVRNAPLHVTFSLHAASPEVYAKMMGPRFDQVIGNIRYFCNKARLGPNVRTTINFGFGRFNHMDSEAIVLLAKDLGVNTVNMYPYYKSPNKLVEDMSLYSDLELANHTLHTAYRTAQRVGQQMVPSQPAYLRSDTTMPHNKPSYKGGCRLPFDNLILKSAPLLKDKMAMCVCNRITLFTVDMGKQVPLDDILWMWNHPALRALRFPDDHVPEICQFCRNPATPWLRSQNNEEYKRRRDQAVRQHLSRWQDETESPHQVIELLPDNIFRVD